MVAIQILFNSISLCATTLTDLKISQELDVVLFREVVLTYTCIIIEGRALPNSQDHFRVNIMTASVGIFTINLPPQPKD